MKKRISGRGIIIEGDSVYLMFRRKLKDDGVIKEYYIVPGGGKKKLETLEEAVIREIKEEFSVDVKINGYVGKDENDKTVAHFFSCSIINGVPKLGGEELKKCSNEKYYEIRKVNIKSLGEIDILSSEMIIKAYNKEYMNFKH